MSCIFLGRMVACAICHIVKNQQNHSLETTRINNIVRTILLIGSEDTRRPPPDLEEFGGPGACYLDTSQVVAANAAKKKM